MLNLIQNISGLETAFWRSPLLPRCCNKVQGIHHDLNQAPNNREPHVTKSKPLSLCNAIHAIVNGTQTDWLKTLEKWTEVSARSKLKLVHASWFKPIEQFATTIWFARTGKTVLSLSVCLWADFATNQFWWGQGFTKHSKSGAFSNFQYSLRLTCGWGPVCSIGWMSFHVGATKATFPRAKLSKCSYEETSVRDSKSCS